MAKLSDKSKLINMCIGLAEGGSRGWPTPLDQAGYNLGKLHPTFRNTSGQRVNPEILFRSHDGILVTSCETNGLTEEYIDKNSDIQMKNIRRELADLNGVDRHEIVYSGMENIDHSFASLDVSDPGLVFNQSTGTLSKRNEFDDDTLNELIHSSSIPRQIPTGFYPFSPEDPLALIGQHLLRHLMSESVSRDTSEARTDGGKSIQKKLQVKFMIIGLY